VVVVIGVANGLRHVVYMTRRSRDCRKFA